MRISLASSSCDTPDFGNVAMKKLIERWAFLLPKIINLQLIANDSQ